MRTAQYLVTRVVYEPLRSIDNVFVEVDDTLLKIFKLAHILAAASGGPKFDDLPEDAQEKYVEEAQQLMHVNGPGYDVYRKITTKMSLVIRRVDNYPIVQG